jgi:hypothetical protein
MIGSSISSGRRPRTLPTLSRTSAAAASWSRVSLKVTVIWLDSCRLIEEMKSMPSMPESVSSRILVTWVSTIAALAPG